MRPVRAAALLMTMAIAASAHAYRVAVWIPAYSSAALSSIQQYGAYVDEANPVWYHIKPDGTLLDAPSNFDRATWRAAMTGAELIPTVQSIINGSFNGTQTAAILADPAMRDVHVNSIVNAVVANAYDGIDIDYEGLPSTAKADFSAFVTSLSEKLHAAGKKLSVTVMSKWPGTENSSSRVWQDWTVIGPAADWVKIMTYDYHWSGGTAGAITPLQWLDQVATYAEANLPKGKIAIGLPFYGYNWPASGKAAAVTYSGAMALAQQRNATITHEADGGEATFQYNDDAGVRHTVYFQDAQAYAAKLNLLHEKHPSITAVAHWAAGQEDPAIWTLLGNDFEIDGPRVVVVQRGTTVEATYKLDAGPSFSGNAEARIELPAGAPSGLATAKSGTATASSPLVILFAPAASSPAGTYQVTLRMTAGGIAREQVIKVVVTDAPVPRARPVRH